MKRGTFGLKPGDVRRAAATLLTGSKEPIVIRVYGEDLGVLRSKSQEIVKIYFSASARLVRTSICGMSDEMSVCASLTPSMPARMVFLTLPMALVGGVLAAWLGGGILSLGSLVGFFTVFGIAARNGILLINHCQHLEREEGMSIGPALVIRGARERLSPS